MPTRTSLNVSLTPKLEKFVHDRVSEGRYQTASEVVREGLRLLEQEERRREAALKALKAKLKRGIAQGDRGEFVTPEEVMKRIERLKAKRAAERA
ncbi:MAG: type II toxin-antitoxin system ParD family antitoxin [Tepidisphaeraceae bacterium]|jgi:antitoxin ParD1/3/4